MLVFKFYNLTLQEVLYDMSAYMYLTKINRKLVLLF